MTSKIKICKTDFLRTKKIKILLITKIVQNLSYRKRALTGLEIYLNSSLHFGKVTVSQILLARGTSPLAQVFKLINNS